MKGYFLIAILVSSCSALSRVSSLQAHRLQKHLYTPEENAEDAKIILGDQN